MANLHLVTGYAGSAHVAADDDGAFNTALIGSGQYVLKKGNKFSAQVITNNSIRISDGDMLMQGRYIRLNEGTYVDLTIDNGTSGKMRNDLICARYTKNSGTGVEECNLVVIKGTESDSNPVDPTYNNGNIIEDHDTINDFPLYRVPLEGLNVQELVPLFSLHTLSLSDIPANSNLLPDENVLADADAFRFYDASANAERKTKWSNLKAKLKAYFDSVYQGKGVTSSHASSHATNGSDPITVSTGNLAANAVTDHHWVNIPITATWYQNTGAYYTDVSIAWLGAEDNIIVDFALPATYSGWSEIEELCEDYTKLFFVQIMNNGGTLRFWCKEPFSNKMSLSVLVVKR